MPAPQYPIFFPIRRVSLLMPMIGAALLTVMGSYLIYAGLTSSAGGWMHVMQAFWGILSVVFFGMCSVVIFWKWRKGNQGVTVDTEGVTDNASGLRPIFIPWDDIDCIEYRRISTNSFAMIHLHNPDAYEERLRGIWLRSAQLNKKWYGTPMAITLEYVTGDPKTIVQTLQQELAEHRAIPEAIRLKERELRK